MGFRDIAAIAAAALNQFSSSSALASSLSASNLPPLGNASSSVWTGYTHGSAIRPSASLQDFTSYRKVDTEEDDFLVGSSTELLPTKPPLYQIQRDGTAHNPRVSKGSTARPVAQAIGLRMQKCWFKVVSVMALVCLFVTLSYFGFQWWRLHWPEKLHYAIVLDCGSTGTRVQVYTWAYRDSSGPDQLPFIIHPTSQHGLGSFPGRKAGQKKEIRAYQRMETEPGLDKLLKNESGVRAAIEPLLQWAGTQIPSSAYADTPLFLLATAGLRRLATPDAQWLLDKAWTALEASPFMCRKSWVKVITGVEEAYYGWVALNYKFRRLGQTPRKSTFGALDLGGSSLQVTFESEDVDVGEYGLNLSVGSAEHRLYAFSHAGFGLNDAFDRSVGLLWSLLHNNNADLKPRRVEVQHPCLHTGYRGQYKCSRCLSQSAAEVPTGVVRKGYKEDMHPEIALVGKPDWEACKALADAVVNGSRLSLSPQAVDFVEPHCALGRYQPPPHGQFYALSGFYVVYKFFGLLQGARFEELLTRGQNFCAMPWKDALDSVVPQPLVEHYCFRAPYVVSLLQHGLHLKEDQITVGSGDMTWTLGAALLEAGAFVPSKLRGAAPRRSSFQYPTGVPLLLNTSFLSVCLLVMMMVVLFTVTYCNNCLFLCLRKPHLPLFTQPSLCTSARFSSIFFPIRLGAVKGDSTARNGDGRYKTPHSPTPSVSQLDRPQQRFGSPLAGAATPMLEFTGLQLPATAGSFTGGKSQLSSRRTQSRDDLHKYIQATC